MVLEQELKLSVLEGEITLKDISIEGYQQSEITSQRLISTYFDTPNQTLIDSGVGLRLRFDGSHWFQTVKEAGQVKNGLHERQEWEHALETKAFDEALLALTPLKALIEDKVMWASVSPVFTTDFIRQTIVLRSQDQSEIELAYDKGSIHAGEKTTSIHEIELELKTGDVNHLQQIAVQLISKLPLETTNSSKAQKGYALVLKSNCQQHSD